MFLCKNSPWVRPTPTPPRSASSHITSQDAMDPASCPSLSVVSSATHWQSKLESDPSTLLPRSVWRYRVSGPQSRQASRLWRRQELFKVFAWVSYQRNQVQNGVAHASTAPFEALIPASVGDIWHVHERGFRMAIFNLGVLGGINLASPIGEANMSELVQHDTDVVSRVRDPIWVVSNCDACHGWRIRPHAHLCLLLHA
jgi:hypothetical protein